LGIILINYNSIHEEIKSVLKSKNACYRSVQNLLRASLQIKKIDKIYRTTILPALLCEWETRSHTDVGVEADSF